MIGNDVVDLQQASIESNWKRKGYLSKLFTREEQDLILHAKEPSLVVWRLWSMKEAAYKIHSRISKKRVFAPARIVCNISAHPELSADGYVCIEDMCFLTRTDFYTDHLHSIAALSKESLAEVHYQIHPYPCPEFNYRNTHPDCVSHHGKYLALAYQEAPEGH